MDILRTGSQAKVKPIIVVIYIYTLDKTVRSTGNYENYCVAINV